MAAAAVSSTAAPPMTMTTATASAVATAAAASSKHRPPNLPTPKSGTYPSSINSPLIPTPNYMKKEECLKTPVTPPSAYLDFLNKLSPSMKSPLSTSQSTTFSFTASARSPYPTAPLSARPVLTSNPSTSSIDSNASLASTASSSSASANTSQSAPAASSSRTIKRPAAVVPPRPSSVTGHGPKTAPLRPEGPVRRPSLMIPPSPSSNSPSLMSPSSARLRSPLSAGAAAAKAYYASGNSPVGWEQALSAGVGKTQPVCVKEVVTRTMTYMRPRSTSANDSQSTKVSTNLDGDTKVEDEETVTKIKTETPADDGSVDDQERTTPQKRSNHRLVGEAPRGKRRKVEGT